MASSITSFSLALGMNCTYSNAAVGSLGSAQLPLNLQQLIAGALTNGVNTANKANQLYVDYRNLANSTSEDINVYAPGSGGVDQFGNTFTIAKVKMLLIQNLSTTEADTLTVGGKGATSGWTSFLSPNTATALLTGGSTLLLWQPGATAYAVGASTTNHLLTMAAAAVTSINYNIIVVGSTS